MSRSYKKHPCFKMKGEQGKKLGKKFANKKVRRNKNISNYGGYKNIYFTDNIFEFRSYYELKEYKLYRMQCAQRKYSKEKLTNEGLNEEYKKFYKRK